MMIKALKSNNLKKVSFFSMGIVFLFFSFYMFEIIIKEEASIIDKQTEKLQKEIDIKDEGINEATQIIKNIERRYLEYQRKLNEQKNLSIDSNKLNLDIQNFITLMNQYYDNNIFKIRVQEVKQDAEYLNIANIKLGFDFNHDFYDNPEISNELENTILNVVYSDLINNFNKDLSILKEKTSLDKDFKIINIAYIKEK